MTDRPPLPVTEANIYPLLEDQLALLKEHIELALPESMGGRGHRHYHDDCGDYLHAALRLSLLLHDAIFNGDFDSLAEEFWNEQDECWDARWNFACDGVANGLTNLMPGKDN